MEKKFSCKSSLKDEMNSFIALRQEDPERCVKIFQGGEELVTICSNGELSKLRRWANRDKSEILVYFLSKAFIAALVHDHLMIADFFISNGYPFNSPSVPCPLHEFLQVVANDDSAVQIIEFLVRHGMNLNHQIPGSWETALHIAVRRKFARTVEFLINAGVDVNAVAKDDIMPLNIAESLEESPEKVSICTNLLHKGARITWRTDSIANPAAHSSVESTLINTTKKQMVKFSGGSFGSSAPVMLVSDYAAIAAATEIENVTPVVAVEANAGTELLTSSGAVSQSSDGGMMFSTS